ncbi:hypothetical protein C8J30_101110 [Rhodobacter viridis]|uniref:Transmembrane protein n=1 Tax=Rhodobacter viridis TaxID=1054202 RepID=A0A318U409_9RHOB|nr:hypothetical protein [Rhodobacter viridis]PYF12729.1 hypothetical protein C8J30_101110 [Rhodobacter viridis]
MTKSLHPIAGLVALATIASFWSATVLSELFGSPTTIATVKTAVLWGFLILIPALAATGASGFALARGAKGGVIGVKRKRMPIIAANGLLVLVPSAFFLAARARSGEFGPGFTLVQAIELIAGAVNLGLLGLNLRDGRRMTAGRRAAGRV